MAGLPGGDHDEQVERHPRAERAARRVLWRDLARTSLHLLAWAGAGLALIGWSWHTGDSEVGRVLWLAGQTVWLCGVLWSVLAAYRRGRTRGDW